MGNEQLANHVKYVKPVYLKRVHRLAREKATDSKIIIQEDIDNFSEELSHFFKHVKKKYNQKGKKKKSRKFK